MSKSRGGYQNHPLWKRCVFFSTFWLWNQWVWFFPYTTSTLKSLAIHTIWSALCDLFTNHTIFCAKSHLFLCQKKKRNTKTAQPNRFQILLKVTNQISGEMDVKKRPCPGGGGPMSPILQRLMSVFISACHLLSALPSLLQFGQGRLSLVTISLYALSLLFGPCLLSEFTLAGPQ